ncbi:MAG: phage holin family protein [Tepidisphaeraceae bacterium]
MEALARFVISAAELAEAEGRALKRVVIRLAVLALTSVLALAAFAVGVAFIVAGIFRALANVVGPAWSAIIIGLGWIVIGLIAALVVPRVLVPAQAAAEARAQAIDAGTTRCLTSAQQSPRAGRSCPVIALNSISTENELAERKQQLIDAASAVDPLKPLKRHPWLTIGAAAAAGLVVGATPIARLLGKAIIPAVTKTAMPLLTAYLSGKVAAKTTDEQNTSEATPPESQ